MGAQIREIWVRCTDLRLINTEVTVEAIAAIGRSKRQREHRMELSKIPHCKDKQSEGNPQSDREGVAKEIGEPGKHSITEA